MANYLNICDEIRETAQACNRNLNEMTLVAVTKYVAWAEIQKLYDQGQRVFGENRIEDAIPKQVQATKDCVWHFIGNLQLNKVRKAVGKFALIHSVDSVRLAQKISNVSQELGLVTPILLQANTSGETSKHGLNAEEWKTCFDNLLMLPGIEMQGLMTMAPLTDDERIIQTCFANLRILRDELKIRAGNTCDFRHLSMGMSHDFKSAIKEGATLLRIGSALY
jgi:PLP dependent protein